MLTPELRSEGRLHIVDHMGDDRSVVRAARVSYGRLFDDLPFNEDKDARLLRYLIRNSHWSPFEHASITFYVESPVFVARQWMRHRSWSFNEVSARYTRVSEAFYVPEVWRHQGEGNKQMSGPPFSEEDNREAQEVYLDALDKAADAYEYLMYVGASRELARMVLPVSLYTQFYATANLRSIFHFIELRDHEHAQPEIQWYARRMASLGRELFPHSFQAWDERAGN